MKMWWCERSRSLKDEEEAPVAHSAACSSYFLLYFGILIFFISHLFFSVLQILAQRTLIPMSVLWVNVLFFFKPSFVRVIQIDSEWNLRLCASWRPLGHTERQTGQGPLLPVYTSSIHPSIHPKGSGALPAWSRCTGHYCFNRSRIDINLSRRCVALSRTAGANYKWRVWWRQREETEAG